MLPKPSGTAMSRMASPSRDGVPARGLPRRRADGHETAPPACVEPAAGRVGPGDGLHGVERVRQPEGDDAAGEQGPTAVQAPADAGQGAGDDGQHHHVGQGIGERDGDADGVAADVPVERLEDERRAQRADGQAGREPVRQQRRRRGPARPRRSRASAEAGGAAERGSRSPTATGSAGSGRSRGPSCTRPRRPPSRGCRGRSASTRRGRLGAPRPAHTQSPESAISATSWT